MPRNRCISDTAISFRRRFSPARAVWPGHGERLALLRQHAGWRQKDLAEAAGVSVRNIRRLESGLERQDVLALLACGRALGARLADVVVM